MVNRINDYLGWEKEERITPHGFRYAIATYLDEKGVSIDSIKYLLGHSESENVQFYLKRDQRKIYQIKKALRELEEELEQSLQHERGSGPVGKEDREEIEQIKTKEQLPFSNELLLRLAEKDPELLEKLLLPYLSK